MKKILLTLVPVIIFGFISNAQLSYNIADNTSLNLPTTGVKQKASMYVTNNGAGTANFEWRILQYYIPPGWSSFGVCDWFLCQPFADTSWHVAACTGNQTDTLYMEVGRGANTVDGCAQARIEYREQGQTSKEVTLTVSSYSSFSSCWPLSTQTFDRNNSIEVYPNPASDEINIKVDGFEGLRLELYNIKTL